MLFISILVCKFGFQSVMLRILPFVLVVSHVRLSFTDVLTSCTDLCP